LVMSPAFDSYEALLAHRLEPEIYSFAVLEDVIAMLDRNGVSGFPIHIKVDTGMHRLGFAPNDTDHLAARLRETDTVRVQSVFSQLAAAGDPDDDAFTERQLIVFGGFADSLAARLPYAFIRHIANSAAIRRWPQAHLDMVRVGIGLYGADSAG